MRRVSAFRTSLHLRHAVPWFVFLAGIGCLKAARIGLLQTELNYYPHSHMFALEKVANELAARGHQVVVIAPQVMVPHLAAAPNKTLEIYEKAGFGLTPEGRAIWMPRTMTWHPSVIKYIISEAQLSSCDSILGNSTLAKRLQDYKFDIFVHETISSCGPSIGLRLNLSDCGAVSSSFYRPFPFPIWLIIPGTLTSATPFPSLHKWGLVCRTA
eukprot:jgi/Botrbrau1/11963/Bobra.341_1s0028.1